ncbi:MAG: TnpV protein [Oscillospiraceae bacterium]|nr:TnpV protein [Oscillospiraceae bacterium]
MTNEEIMELSQGKYARQRLNHIKKWNKPLYEELVESKELDEHLAYTQQCVDEYVEMRLNKLKLSDEYLNANSAEQMRMVNSEVMFAESDAYREWIGYDEVDEEEDEEVPGLLYNGIIEEIAFSDYDEEDEEEDDE